MPYSQKLAAANGLAPYIWLANGLAPDLTLGSDGTLAGIPTMGGDYDVSIEVIDASTLLQVAEQSFRLVIQ